MNEWHLIETAPKDGTRIWLADSRAVVTGYWSTQNRDWRCDWFVGSAGDEPSHWMHIPKPPVLS